MRLFIAINFSDEVKKRFLEIQDHLRSQSTRGNFTRPENLHLTLIFIGEAPGERIGELFSVMKEIKPPSFEISFDHSGCFTHSQKELWWLGVKAVKVSRLSLMKSEHLKGALTYTELMGQELGI